MTIHRRINIYLARDTTQLSTIKLVGVLLVLLRCDLTTKREVFNIACGGRIRDGDIRLQPNPLAINYTINDVLIFIYDVLTLFLFLLVYHF